MIKKYNKNNSGFSLIELIIVIAILSVLIGIVAPNYLKYVERSKRVVDITTAKQINDAFYRVIATDNPELNIDGYSYTRVAWDNTRRMPVAGHESNFLDYIILELGEVPKIKSLKTGMWIVDYDPGDGHVESIKIYDKRTKESWIVYPEHDEFLNRK